MTTKHNTKVTPVDEAEVMPETTFSAKDLAAELGVTAKDFRRWLRTKTTDRANKGGRWTFDSDAKTTFLAAYREDHKAKVTPAA